VPRVSFGEVLACKYVSQVGAAVCTLDFCSLPIWVGLANDGAWDFVVEAWPAAVGFKLVFGPVQFCAAPFADVGAFLPECVVFASEWHFGAFVDYDLFFFWGKFLKIGLGLRTRQIKTPLLIMCLGNKKLFTPYFVSGAFRQC
jgi:hypothetical protein